MIRTKTPKPTSNAPIVECCVDLGRRLSAFARSAVECAAVL
jgi:hypothetical protein